MPALRGAMDGHHDPSSDLSSFNRQVADLFADLSSSSSPDSDSSLLSLAWTRRLLDTFLIALEQFRFLLHTSSSPRPPADRLLSDFFDRAVKSLDLCTALRDAIHRVRTWHKHLQIVLASLATADPLREGPVRRARKALADLAIMMLDERDLPGSASGFRNRSFARGANTNANSRDHHHGHGAPAGPHHRRSSSGGGGGGSGSSSNGHFRSLTWSVSRGWSATKQLQAIGSGLTPPRGVGTSDMSASVYTMGAVLYVSMLSLAAALPCQCDRTGSLSGAHFTAPPRVFSWGPSIYSIYEKVLEEWKRREKKGNSGLLKEIGEIERISRQLGEIIDAAHFPLEKEKEAEIKEVAQELEKVNGVIKEGLDPLERQIREVFNRLVRSRTEGLDSLNRPSD